MNKPITVAISLALAAGLTASADVLTPEQAWQRAAGTAQAKAKGLSGAETPRLLYTEMAAASPAAYIFSQPGRSEGYIILSADDMAEPMLGYSENTAFDSKDIPDGLQYWLGFYAREIEYARHAGLKGAPLATPVRTAIAPMLKTTWDQGAPYYDLCPKKDGKQTYTGCVATAMAQVMKYFEWPAQPHGSIGYITDGITINVNFDDYTFDWANMLNSYTMSSGTQAQRRAVAELMYCVGASLKMQYGTSASGTPSENIPVAAITYFDYNKYTHQEYRDFYSKTEWEDLVYENLANYGPTILSGSDADGSGHCFVCDGYKDGYYHINWGWSGLSDGYYLLSSLKPIAQGIGGAAMADVGFVYKQDGIFGMSKPKAGDDYFYGMYFYEGYTLPSGAKSLGSSVKVDGWVYSMSSTTIKSGTLGLEFTASDGTTTYARGEGISDVAPWKGAASYNVTLPNSSTLKDGKYKVRPAWVNSDYVRRPIYNNYNYVQTYTATVSGGKVTFTPDEVGTASITIDKLAIAGDAYAGRRLHVDVTVTNKGQLEYYNTICAGLFATDAKEGVKPLYAGENQMIDVEGGKTEVVSYSSLFKGCKAGTYMLRIYNPKTNAWIGSGVEVELKTAPATKISVSNFGLSDGQKWALKGAEVDFEFDVACEQGEFEGNLYVGVAKGNSTYWTKTYATPYITLKAGETAHYSLQCTLPSSFNVGNEIQASLADGTAKNKATVYATYTFTIGDPTGITDIESEAEVVSTTLYNLQGIIVPADAAVRGHYIKVTRYADGTVTSEHVVK